MTTPYIHQASIVALRNALSSIIVGQPRLLDRLIIGLLAGGHILVEGLPGLAKTTAVKALAGSLQAHFKRIQFTPDLMPGDLTGTDIYDPRSGAFHFVPGPLFNEIILADEINRAPAKVQSALLEAMQERQITVGGQTRALPQLFMVMATQNPIEQAGTYPLPEAQLDRFMLHVTLDYPSEEEEREILRRDRALHLMDSPSAAQPVLDVAAVLAARRELQHVHLSEPVEAYIVTLVRATRELGKWRADWAQAVEVGASPRASLALAHAGAAHAYLHGRDYVSPDDVREMAPDVLRHRLVLSLDARVRLLSRDAIVAGLLDAVPAP
ncbi:AAA family ATPase [Polaromonas sp.]|uniref:AAA family ATPase n=1 Tax=Polaromonas sp. TaxID=1869339 RepID=UPI001D487CB1|nr:AAA family ATPase [Polaromonas sp.]MBT9477193.1 AAA family ATPase [Polaromonas sp.]